MFSVAFTYLDERLEDRGLSDRARLLILGLPSALAASAVSVLAGYLLGDFIRSRMPTDSLDFPSLQVGINTAFMIAICVGVNIYGRKENQSRRIQPIPWLAAFVVSTASIWRLYHP